MRKLIHANFVRMVRGKIFWIIEAALAGYAVFAYASVAGNIKRGLGIPDSFLFVFFNEMLAMGAVMALFTILFLGVEYSNGVIRNKISTGHRRRDIYLANLVTCYTAGVIQFLTYSLTALLTGWLLLGETALIGLNQMSWRIVCSLLIILCYAAVFTLIIMLDDHGMRVTAVSFVLVLAFFILVMQIFGDLSEPEVRSRTVTSQEGEVQIEEAVPNPRYVTGTKRVVYEWLDTFLPADQAMYILLPETDYTLKAPLCLLGESIVLTAFGLYFFKRKDIR